MQISTKILTFLFLSFIFLTNQKVVAQIDFEIFNPSPPDAGYVDFAVLSPDHVIAVTYYGAVYTTIDGGETWTSSVLSGGDQLTTITFLDNSTGYITASTGAIYKTTDSGDSWEIVNENRDDDILIRNIYIKNEMDIWAISSSKHLFYSSDGGVNWEEKINSYDTGAELADITFQNDTTAWVTGAKTYRSTDSGLTWEEYDTGYETEDVFLRVTFEHITFLNDSTGWMAGDSLAHTTDGGGTWVDTDIDDSYSYSNLKFINENIGFVIAGSELKRTDDAGQTWTNVQGLPLSLYINDIIFADASVGWLINSGNFMKSEDGGVNWSSINEGFNYDLYSIYTETGQEIFVAGRNSYSSFDGGENWQEIDTESKDIHEVQFLNSTTGFMVGEDGAFFKTTDGGNTWNREDIGTEETLSDIHFIDESKGFISAHAGTVLKTEDGGDSWTVVDHGLELEANTNFVEIHSITENRIIIGGYYANIISEDGGDSWTKYEHGYNVYNGFHFFDENNGYATGRGASVYQTQDGGESWTEVLEHQSSNDFTFDIHFFDEDNGMVVGFSTAGEYNLIYTTTDGGENWKRTHTTTGGYSKMHVVDMDNIYAVGNGGIIIRLSFSDSEEEDEETSITEEEMPNNFSLYDNYPNPFNPTTTINFQLKSAIHVTLSVFNSLGQKVAVITEGQFKQGNHSVNFNADQLSSGVYFYELRTADNQSQIKKMTLIK